MTKIIAFHLPQFHEIPENSKWWGEGFTEWTNTKKSKPLFKGHDQPKEPLNDYYYNLLDKSSLQWQIDLAKKYGIYGFCFYHYWFVGKQLLEKPVQIYLENRELDLPFCFSWANHSWTRTWLEKNDILLEQTYGGPEDWKKHFMFLLDYFKDERYIKIDHKPVFIFNRPLNFEGAGEMVNLWNRLAKDNGISEIYFVETLSAFQNNGILKESSALMESHPSYTKTFIPRWYVFFQWTLKLIFIKFLPNFYPYDYFWKIILKIKPVVTNKTVFPGAFVNWDNTARRPNKGVIFLFFTVKKFKNYLLKQIIRTNKVYKTEFLFLNAWNEWAEGNYLEPDKKYGTTMLEALKSALDESDAILNNRRV